MKIFLSAVIVLGVLIGCDQKVEGNTPKAVKVEKKIEKAARSSQPLPDVGKVELVNVSSTGTGVTPTAAVNEALTSAIVQVNGTSISSKSMQLNFGLQATQNSMATAESSISANAQASIARNKGNESASAKYSESAKGSASASSVDSIRGQAFADQIVAQSKGHIAEFKIINVEGPNLQGLYVVKIEAKIAKFKGPADSGKIKIVIAPLKSNRASFNFAGEKVSSEQVLASLRQRIIDALSQTGRFTILDRQFGSDIQGELNMIASGQTSSTDLAKIGQALSADLIWIGTVNDFAYDKHVRTLRTSDRKLVSFSGGWSMSQRLVNITTKQIMQSTTLEGKAPSVAPTTLGASVDKRSTLQFMESDIIKQATEAILLRTFPISVVDMDGSSVVLSQGGKSVIPQSRYKVFLLGKEIKDPQTGQSLGRMEKFCCEVVIERVTPTMSYGTLENLKVSLGGVRADSLQIRESVPAKESSKRQEGKAETYEKPRAARQSSGKQAAGDAARGGEKSVLKDKDW